MIVFVNREASLCGRIFLEQFRMTGMELKDLDGRIHTDRMICPDLWQGLEGKECLGLCVIHNLKLISKWMFQVSEINYKFTKCKFKS